MTIRILHLVSPDGDWEPFSRVANLAAALREHDISSVIAAPDHSRLWELAEASGVEVLEHILQNSLNPFNWKKIAGLIQDTGATIIHTHDPETASIAARALTFLKNVHLVTTRYSLQPAIQSAEHHRKAAAIVCPSQALADVFAKLPDAEGKIHVVADGVNLDAANRSEDERAAIRAAFRDAHCPGKTKPLFIVNIAPMNDDAAHDQLLEAMPEIFAALPQTHLFIMGEGARRDDLKRQRKITALKGDVTFLEPDKAFHRLLAAADAYVSWSRNDVSGLMVQAAMAAGRGVALRDSGCYGELVENGKSGILVDGDGADALRQPLLELLEHRAKREKLGRNAKEKATLSFGIKTAAERIADIYRTLE